MSLLFFRFLIFKNKSGFFSNGGLVVGTFMRCPCLRFWFDVFNKENCFINVGLRLFLILKIPMVNKG